MKLCGILLFILFLCGCATGWLNVDSSPQQAEVFIKTPGAQDFKSLGPAPLNRKVSEIRAMINGEKSVVIEARKAGHQAQSLLIADLDSASDIRISFQLPTLESLTKAGDPQAEEAKNQEFQKRIVSELEEKNLLKVNALVDNLFAAQRLTQVGRLDEALQRLSDLEKEHPNVAAIYEMQGGIAFMRSDFNKALDAYSQAARNNPNNLELLNMRAYLEKKLNLNRRTPAGNN